MSGEKTEKPTPKKLKESREKGQVAAGKDIQTLSKLISFYAILFVFIDYFTGQFSTLFDLIQRLAFSPNSAVLAQLSDEAYLTFLKVTMPLVMSCAIAGLLFTWLQTGFIISADPVKPSFKKMDAVQNIKNMFSKKSMIQLLLNISKVIILFIVAWLVVSDHIQELAYIYKVGLDGLFYLLLLVIKLVIFWSLGLFVILALIDWWATRAHHIKGLMMSKHDIKDEHKKSEGDPMMKGKRKQEHRRILNSSLQSMSSAKALVANPTHISVALDYQPGVHDLPYVLLMGEDEEALVMRQEAKRLKIPVITHVKLARAIYADCEEQSYIQDQHLEMAAEVFRIVLEIAENPQEGQISIG